MAAPQAISFVADVLAEAVSLVGAELAMLGVAALSYVLFSGLAPGGARKRPGIGRKVSGGLKCVAAATGPPTSSQKGVARPLKPMPSAQSELHRQESAARPATPPMGSSSGGGYDLNRLAGKIRACAKERNLEGAKQVFGQLQASGAVLSPLIYNCMLDACAQCGDLKRAAEYFAEMKTAGFIDVVGYNIMIKAHLASGRPDQARGLVSEMGAHGLQANSVTYHELLHAKVLAQDRRGMWGIIDEMQKAGVRTNSVTCSILLKSLTAQARPAEIQRIVTLVEANDPVDAVLLCSLIEACIRVQQLDLLTGFMGRYRNKDNCVALPAPAYGSMIKAYGQVGDIVRVRGLWQDMEKEDVMPTSITLGCMIEALVANDCPDEALDLIHRQLECEERRGCINTISYSTVIKGFASKRRVDKVFEVYDEMRARGVPCNTITYNTLLDACAKACVMKRASQLLEDMGQSGVEPDLITYSSLVKGFCAQGDVDRAFHILGQMKGDGKFTPDEIMYNSILDGCAKQHRVDDALRILEEMRSAGVKPSNYTLSILVKILGHAKRLNNAFSMVEDLSSRNGFRPNIQVYTCLMQACFQNRCLDKALALHDTMLADVGCKVDAKFYAVLARGCVQLRQPLKAVQVVRTAYRLRGASLAAPAGRSAAPVGVEQQGLEELVARLRAGSAEEQRALAELASELREAHGLCLDSLPAPGGGRGDRRTHGGGCGGGPRRPAGRQ